MLRFIQRKRQRSDDEENENNISKPLVSEDITHCDNNETGKNSQTMSDADDITQCSGTHGHLSKPPGPGDISQSPTDGPRQPLLKPYPFQLFGNQRRAFSQHWCKQCTWLEYSVTENAAFCFPCRHFAINPPEKSFIEQGLKNWKRGWKNYRGTTQALRINNLCWHGQNSVIFLLVAQALYPK